MKAWLEITWKEHLDDAGNNWLAIYELILPVPPGDIRGNDEGVARVELGKTRVQTQAKGFPIDDNGDIETPFRDGVHARWDAQMLGVEAWAVYGARKTKIA